MELQQIKSPSGRFQRVDPPELIESSVGLQRNVYRALDNELGTEVMWTEYRNLSLEAMNGLEERLQQIIDLEHPNLLKYHSGWVDTANRTMVVVCAMCSGNLDKFLSRKVEVRFGVMRSWIRQMLLALEYLHGEGIIHRAVLCRNVFISSSTEPHGHRRAKRGHLVLGALEVGIVLENTHPSELNGTPGFMAPDYVNETWDEKVDVYALGMTVYQLFAFQPPYHECSTAHQIFQKQMLKELPSGLAVIKNPDIVTFIEQSLQFSPSLRPSASALLSSLFLQEDDATSDSDRSISSSMISLPSEGSRVQITQAPVMLHNAPDLIKAYRGGTTSSLPLTATGDAGLTPPILEQYQRSLQETDFSIKCFWPGQSIKGDSECVRVSLQDMDSVQALLDETLASLIVNKEDVVKIKYKDEESDFITITPKTTLSELYRHACSIHVYTKTEENSGSSFPTDLIL